MMKNRIKNQFTVSSHTGVYTVSFCRSLTKSIQQVIHGPVHVLADSSIYKHHTSLRTDIRDIKSIKVFEAEEKYKSLERVTGYISFLLKNGVQKNHTLLVIGGGQIQDIGSFTAHILFRGVPWVFVPTTLLAMADSCIGSKSAINIGKYKNQVGAFYPPTQVLICQKFLATLPGRGIYDGKGEILKHALIAGGKTYRQIIRDIDSVPDNESITRTVLTESLMVKKRIIEKDEFDTGIRKILNYGHTFGHALEGYTGNKVSHGIGVTIGMDMANFISMKRGLLSEKQYKEISRVLRRNIPYTSVPVRDGTRYLEFISRDKKVRGRTVTAILCRGIGRIERVPLALDRAFVNDIQDYCAYFKTKSL